MRKRSSLPSVLLLFILFFSLGLSNAFADPTGKSKPEASTAVFESDSAFFCAYSKKLGFSVDSTCNRDLISTVAGWIGTPYRHAGYSKAGIDCSGFVSKIYKDVFGLELTHSSSAMIYQMNEHVKKSELKEGDILFFRIHGKRISHVGLYLGDNKFIHASSYRGIVVDDLRQPYYMKAYYTAGRPKLKE